MFQGVVLKVCLTEKAFKNIGDKKKVEGEDSKQWIKENIVGNITKFELDNERMKETNALDMMQNSSIIYHTESILEMQMCCLISMILLTAVFEEKQMY
jgi:hypothetical protein